MPLRKIGRIGKVYPRRHTKNQLILIKHIAEQDEVDINNGEELRLYLGVDTREEAYEIARQMYNEYIPKERDRLVRLDESNRLINNKFIHLLEIGDIDEITINMNDYRQHFTLEEILNRIILAFIDNNQQQGNFYTLQIGNNNYTLNSEVRNRLINMVRKNIIVEEEHGSDGILLQEIKEANEIIIRRWKGNNKYETPDGAFFKYKNITDMDFKKYGIFSNHGEWIRVGESRKGVKDKMKFETNYKDNCFIYALKEYAMKENSTLKMDVIEEVKYYVKNLKVPMNVLSKIADVIQHKIKVNNIKYEFRNMVYGKCYENEISLGLIDEHYFLNDTTEYTSYAIENYDNIKHLDDYNYIYKIREQNGKIYYKKDKKRCINSFQAIKLLMENKDKYLKRLTTQETQLAYTQFYGQVEESFESLSYSSKNVRPVKTENGKENKKKHSKSINVFFDFETNTNEGKHKPYLCCCCFETNGKKYEKKFFGKDCGKELLDYIPDNSTLIAHNASYDFRFIVKYFDRIKSEISKGNRLVSCEAYYNGKEIKVKDSYSLISMKLKDFNKNLKLNSDMRKEVISHQLYTQENIDKRFINIDYAVNLLDNDDKEHFYKNINDWGLICENNTFDCLEYSAIYCMKDCEILKQGYNAFRGMVVNSVGLNIDNILTIPSLSHKYFIKNKCYEGVYEIGGTPQRFIQKSVVGGRCMTNNNLMIMCFEILNDFDAVSLYPSAMSMMGFLKGVPKKLVNKKSLSYDFLKEKDGYFVEIKIKKVGVKRDFPLLSYIDENGVRKWTNDMVGKTMYVNKISLEDAIEFQGIEFEILRGYYYNQGRNNSIKNVIKTLFEERKKWKLQENPIEIIYKLIMNSGYGKSIMKEIGTESKFFNKKESFQKYLSKNYNYINEFTEYGDGKYKVSKVKPFNQHFNLAHVGSEILSMSKRIMNRVMCLAEDIGLKILYTDTDSIHIKDTDIKMLSNAYKNKYHKTLIGKELGQFHTDFELKVDGVKCNNVVSYKSIFLGKKCYLDLLRGNHPITNEIKYGYHIRMKGVNEGAVLISSEELKKKGDVWGVYMKLWNGNSITFDLVKGGVMNFKYDKNYNIITDPIFTRELKFKGSKLTIKNGNEVLRTTRKDGKKFKIVRNR
jgi:hypothetical protein